MAKVEKKVRDAKRNELVGMILDLLNAHGEDTGLMASNIIVCPMVYPDGTEGFYKVTVAIPTEEDFDGYDARDMYSDKVRLKLEKAKEKNK